MNFNSINISHNLVVLAAPAYNSVGYSFGLRSVTRIGVLYAFD